MDRDDVSEWHGPATLRYTPCGDHRPETVALVRSQARAQYRTDRHRRVRHPVHCYLAATLDGFVTALDTLFKAHFILPWSFSEDTAAEKYMAQLQHNMWVTTPGRRRFLLSPAG